MPGYAGRGTGVAVLEEELEEPEEEEDELVSSSSAEATSSSGRTVTGGSPQRKHCLHFASIMSALGSDECTV